MSSNSEDNVWAARKMSEAADRCSSAAQMIDEAIRKFSSQMEPGYGGNGPRLIELLEKHVEPPEDEWVQWPEVQGQQFVHINRATNIGNVSFEGDHPELGKKVTVMMLGGVYTLWENDPRAIWFHKITTPQPPKH